MSEGQGVLYNNAKDRLGDGAVDLSTGGDTIKVILVSGHTPDIDGDTDYADVSADEYATGLGYTAGGATLANQDFTVDNANDLAKFDADDVLWSSLGALSPATPSHAILYDDTHANNLLICYFELGTTATDGSDYTLQWGSNGIFQLT